MIFTETKLPKVFVIDIERKEDERGFFARTFCQQEFAARGLNTQLVQCSISYNRAKGTLRGLHMQIAPHAETKIVRCTRGAIWDVCVDLRPDSPTYRAWIGVELSVENRRILYIPEGCAHGFQTITDDSEVEYQMSAFYAPAAARGFRYDDPAFAIPWPVDNKVVSVTDSQLPAFSPTVKP